MVEVRGVEPRSEEKTLKTSTYLARLLRFTRGNSGRQDWPRAIQSRSRLWQDFARSPSKQERTIPSYSTFISIPMGENRGNGLLNLIKQPVRSCSWHLSVYRFFSVDTETTIRSSELPHPRRIQVTPRVLFGEYRLFGMVLNSIYEFRALDSIHVRVHICSLVSPG
jgi:hypothetical protein